MNFYQRKTLLMIIGAALVATLQVQTALYQRGARALGQVKPLTEQRFARGFATTNEVSRAVDKQKIFRAGLPAAAFEGLESSQEELLKAYAKYLNPEEKASLARVFRLDKKPEDLEYYRNPYDLALDEYLVLKTPEAARFQAMFFDGRIPLSKSVRPVNAIDGSRMVTDDEKILDYARERAAVLKQESDKYPHLYGMVSYPKSPLSAKISKAVRRKEYLTPYAVIADSVDTREAKLNRAVGAMEEKIKGLWAKDMSNPQLEELYRKKLHQLNELEFHKMVRTQAEHFGRTNGMSPLTSLNELKRINGFKDRDNSVLRRILQEPVEETQADYLASAQKRKEIADLAAQREESVKEMADDIPPVPTSFNQTQSSQEAAYKEMLDRYKQKQAQEGSSNAPSIRYWAAMGTAHAANQSIKNQQKTAQDQAMAQMRADQAAEDAREAQDAQARVQFDQAYQADEREKRLKSQQLLLNEFYNADRTAPARETMEPSPGMIAAVNQHEEDIKRRIAEAERANVAQITKEKATQFLKADAERRENEGLWFWQRWQKENKERWQKEDAAKKEQIRLQKEKDVQTLAQQTEQESRQKMLDAYRQSIKGSGITPTPGRLTPKMVAPKYPVVVQPQGWDINRATGRLKS